MCECPPRYCPDRPARLCFRSTTFMRPPVHIATYHSALTLHASIIILDSRTHCAQGEAVRCEAPLTVPSLRFLVFPGVTDSSVSGRSDTRVLQAGCRQCVVFLIVSGIAGVLNLAGVSAAAV